MYWKSILKIKTPNGDYLIVKDVEMFKQRLRLELNAVGLPYFGAAGHVTGKQRQAMVVFKEKWLESDYGTRLEITVSVRNPNIHFREYFVITLLEDKSGDFIFLTAIGPNLIFGANEILNNEVDLIIAIGKAVERTIEEKIEEKRKPAAMDISAKDRETSEQTAEQLAEENPGYELHEGVMRKIPKEKVPESPAAEELEDWAESTQLPDIEQRERSQKKKGKRFAPSKYQMKEPEESEEPAIREGKHSRGLLGRQAWKLKKAWRNIIKKTTEFSFDPKVPRGRAIGRRRGTDDIQVGLSRWKETINKKPEYFEGGIPGNVSTKDIGKEIARTIGHEYTHIATTEEVMAERKKATTMIGDAWDNKTDPTAGFEKYAVTNYMDELMARAAHGEMQLETFLNRGALQYYAKHLIDMLTRAIYSAETDNVKQITNAGSNWIMMPEHYEEVPGLREFRDKAKEVIPRKMMELATKHREKYGIQKAELKPSLEIPTMRTNLKPIPRKPIEQNCNETLKEYSEQLKDNNGHLMHVTKEGTNEWQRRGNKPGKYMERIISKYEPIPEKVACKALEYLEKGEEDENIQYRNVKDEDGKSWTIGWRVDKIWDEEDMPADEHSPDEIWADAGVLLIIEKNPHIKGDVGTQVYLSHRIVLYREFDEKLENEAIEAIDWR